MAITVYNGDRFPFYDLIHKYMKWTEISQYSQDGLLNYISREYNYGCHFVGLGK